MSLLSREQMQALATTQDVPVPQCGDAVAQVRMLSAIERDEFDATINDGAGNVDLKNFRGRLLAKACVSPVLTAAEWGEMPSAPVQVIFAAAQKLNGMMPTAVDAAEKNSESVPSAASSSA